MKKLLLFASVILWAFGLQSQPIWEWTEPAPLTDSLRDNTNADLFWNWDELFMVWEKAVDSTASSIFMDNILDTSSPVEVIADSGVHYRKPLIMAAEDVLNPDFEFHILYESDQNGNLDIYYVTYKSDGTFTDPSALANTPDDESYFSVGRDPIWWDNFSYNRNAVAYIRNDSLLVINYMSEGQSVFWSEEVFIDTAIGNQTVITGKGYGCRVYYLKNNSSEKHIYSSWCDQNGIWSEPEVVYDSFDCRNMDNILHRDGIIWSSKKDTSWRIIHNSSWYPGYYTYDLHQSDPLDPTAIGIAYGVDFIDGWVATPYADTGTAEIYMSNYSWEFVNFSLSGTDNRNPNTFEGEHDNSSWYCWYDYLVWESYRNGHWQIWYSKVLQCAGSVEENTHNITVLSPYPNPFTNEITIEFSLLNRENVSIEIYDLMGKLLIKLTEQVYDEGAHQLRWDATGMAAGIYLIKLTAGGRVYTSKTVKE